MPDVFCLESLLSMLIIVAGKPLVATIHLFL